MRGLAPRQSILPFDDSEPPAVSADSLPDLPPRRRRQTATARPGEGTPVTRTWTVEYVRHPRARRYLLRVRVNGTVRATIPRGGTKRDAVRFVEAHTSWIVEQLEVAARARAARPPAMPADERRALIERAKRELPPRLLALADRFGLAVRKVSIRNQKGRWGSCSRQAHICLNWRLVTMPDWVCDYVLIHELMHLRRMDHSPAFWKHVAVACPDYHRARAWLRAHGGIVED